jgi:salicylate hydroxylase
VNREHGELAELRAFFAGLDPLLNVILSQGKTAHKWKLSHLLHLETWVNGSVALMGDTVHATLPYQAQGAAMAVEDGATIVSLLGLLDNHLRSSEDSRVDNICRVLRLYQDLRKERTKLNVEGAESNRTFLHMPAGPELEKRDQLLRDWDWDDQKAKSE